MRPSLGALPLVYIDPGHGGPDPGTIGRNGTYEKNVTLAVAQELQRQGKWRHLWRVTGHYANVSIFDVESHDELHEALTRLPLWPYLKINVTPLSKHPSSID